MADVIRRLTTVASWFCGFQMAHNDKVQLPYVRIFCDNYLLITIYRFIHYYTQVY